jgi:hypothetical protein
MRQVSFATGLDGIDMTQDEKLISSAHNRYNTSRQNG